VQEIHTQFAGRSVELDALPAQALRKLVHECIENHIPEQRAYLSPGDWIIKEPIEVCYYPCKPDVFVKKYEKVVLK
jgi:hypothetical protein